ncbi:GGDEF domain-containing protein [Leeia oryzae]|uniref:GGDEF domain-containing protein n=1 Tax=Leeia oryzae TaxID=356662 RepID=UPI000373BDD6|nr:sensor domain-containing diguanylate cyclase [Leeia oryzae]
MLNNDQLTDILSAFPDPVFILSQSGKYVAILGGTDHRYYHDGSSLIGKSILDVIPEDKARWFIEQISLAIQHQGLHIVEYSLGGEEVAGLEEDGPIGAIWFEGRIQLLPGLYEGEQAVLWVASNITERHELEIKLRQLTEIDELTGIFNRRKLMSTLQDEFEQFTRYQAATSLFIFDIDNFKHINDSLGHHAGDEVLRVVADVCKHHLRKTDLAARLGGDEFVVLMPHTHPEQALQLAERIRSHLPEAIATMLQLGPISQLGTISGGISEMRTEDASMADVLRRADAALYQAKGEGRNCLKFL